MLNSSSTDELQISSDERCDKLRKGKHPIIEVVHHFILFLEFALRKQTQSLPPPTGSISPTTSWGRPNVSRTSSNRSDRINPDLYMQATVSSVAN